MAFVDICERYDYIKNISNVASPARPAVYMKLKSPKVLVICGNEIPDIMSDLEPERTYRLELAWWTVDLGSPVT
ncbi:hypothetical protein GQ600_4615 [Phytophthora cactorum]|nr:hypothetical protein GQ600_4615 [Phytophthora cactorum]